MTKTPIRNLREYISRNKPCPCGSGKKFKVCCLDMVNEEDRKFSEMANKLTEAEMNAHMELCHAQEDRSEATDV